MSYTESEIVEASILESIDRFDAEVEERIDENVVDSLDASVAPAIRKDFPETWIWDSIEGYAVSNLLIGLLLSLSVVF